MRVVIDYGRPIGSWCPNDDNVLTPCLHGCPLCIPAYEQVPEGEREPADEPDEDMVCTFLHGAYVWVGLGPRIDADDTRVDWFRDGAADAVLWVAEGRLP